MLIYVLCFILGVAVGIALAVTFSRKSPVGTLKMDYSTGDPYLFLEVHIPIDELLKMDTVELKVDHTRQ